MPISEQANSSCLAIWRFGHHHHWTSSPFNEKDCWPLLTYCSFHTVDWLQLSRISGEGHSQSRPHARDWTWNLHHPVMLFQWATVPPRYIYWYIFWFYTPFTTVYIGRQILNHNFSMGFFCWEDLTEPVHLMFFLHSLVFSSGHMLLRFTGNCKSIPGWFKVLIILSGGSFHTLLLSHCSWFINDSILSEQTIALYWLGFTSWAWSKLLLLSYQDSTIAQDSIQDHFSCSASPPHIPRMGVAGFLLHLVWPQGAYVWIYHRLSVYVTCFHSTPGDLFYISLSALKQMHICNGCLALWSYWKCKWHLFWFQAR